MARRKDDLAAAHRAQIERLIAGAASVAATAQQNAHLANEHAARARKAADRAEEYKKQAQASAAEAKKYADQAKKSAERAEASARQAAESAKQARAAEASAHDAARRAEASAARAEASAAWARSSADEAWTAANNARSSAIQAGKDSEAADKASTEAKEIALKKQREEEARSREEAARKARAEFQKMKEDAAAELGEEGDDFSWQDGLHLFLDGVGSTNIPFVANAANAGNCVWYGAEGEAVDAAASCIGIAPGGGVANGAKAAKGGKKLWKFLKTKFSGKKPKSIGVRGCNSFTPETPVVMADGTTKPIRAVAVGDRVLATDPVTGRTEAQPVENVITGNGLKHLTTLTVDTDGEAGDAIGTVTATAGHPVWTQDLKAWTKAGEVKPGALLRTSAGTWVRVTATQQWTASAQVFNLTVRDLHTYYVRAGGASVLVHNTGAMCELAAKIDLPNIKMTNTVAGHLREWGSNMRMSRAYMNAPRLTAQEIMAAGKPMADPRGVPNAVAWEVPGAHGGKLGKWELVIDTSTNTIIHFLYKGNKG